MKLNCAIAIIVAALCSMLLLTSCTYTREDIKNADEKGYERGYDYGYKDGYKDGESSTSGDVEGLENHIDELYDLSLIHISVFVVSESFVSSMSSRPFSAYFRA